MRNRRVLFVRVGHMTFYAGSQPDDPRPIGGGAYNRKNIGGEVYNFKDIGGNLYGYYQAPSNRTALERIDPNCEDGSLDQVLVLFFATLPKTGGQVLVGWYKDATVFRESVSPLKSIGKQRGGGRYNVSCTSDNGTLLPTWRREHFFKKTRSKKGRLGTSHVYYPYEENGERRDTSSSQFRWMAEAVKFADTYSAENLLTEIEAEALPAVDDVIQNTLREAEMGQGIKVDPHVRKAIELHSMKRGARYFSKNYVVDPGAHKTKPYDLECRDKTTGAVRLYVEVKGTQSLGAKVFLTANEVTSARKNRTALYVLHSIQVTGKGLKAKASGGTPIIVNPWKLEELSLKAISYSYEVP